MNDKIIRKKDLELFTQSFGNPEDPALLLIAGATVSMLFWDKEFCELLSSKGIFVIRYDFRDTGQSTSYAPGEKAYDIEDLVDDSQWILSEYGIQKAHLMGISLGAMIAQIAAMKYPEHILSITLMASMPWADPILPTPEMDSKILEFHAEAAGLDWNQENEVVEYMLKGSALMSGKKPLNQDRAREYIITSFRRAKNFQSQYNHAQLDGAMDFYNKMEQISCPSLVIHGSEDIICPFNNALSLIHYLKSQNLLVLEGTGHELHEEDWAKIADAVQRLIQSSPKT